MIVLHDVYLEISVITAASYSRVVKRFQKESVTPNHSDLQ